jgi:hypothetical protein
MACSRGAGNEHRYDTGPRPLLPCGERIPRDDCAACLCERLGVGASGLCGRPGRIGRAGSGRLFAL